MRCIRIRFSAVDHESWRSTGRIRRHGPQECWRPWGCVQASNGSWTGGECDGPDCRWCGGCRGASHGCSAPTVSDAWNTEQIQKTTQLLRKLNWPVSHRYLVHPSPARQDQFQQAFSKGRAQNVAYAVQNCLQIQSACSWASLARNGPAGTICTMLVWNYWCSQHLHRIFAPCAAQNLST